MIPFLIPAIEASTTNVSLSSSQPSNEASMKEVDFKVPQDRNGGEIVSAVKGAFGLQPSPENASQNALENMSSEQTEAAVSMGILQGSEGVANPVDEMRVMKAVMNNSPAFRQ